jgi:hypothetical protein
VGSWTDVANSVCPLARALAIVGDRWTILILRELFLGSCRFDRDLFAAACDAARHRHRELNEDCAAPAH